MRNFECIEFEIERAGRRLSVAQLRYGDGVTDIGQDRHSAQTWNKACTVLPDLRETYPAFDAYRPVF